MISLEIYRYILLTIIILIALVATYLLIKSKLNKQIKIVIFWYFLILELNLLNILGVITFYNKNKNRKGPKGLKGIIGPRGVVGDSVLCESCGIAGSVEEGKHADNKVNGISINHDFIQPGRCKFPYVANYVYKHQPTIFSDFKSVNFTAYTEILNLLKAKNVSKPESVEWCATSVDPNNHKPETIGFYRSSIKSALETQEKLEMLKKMYLQDNAGILDIQLVSGNTTRDAKRNANSGNGWTLLEQDLNEGTGGKFIYMNIKRGTGPKGISDIKLIVYDYTSLDQLPANSPYRTLTIDGKEYKLHKSSLNLNKDSNSGDKLGHHIYLYVIESPNKFIKDIKIQKSSETPPSSNYTVVKYPQYDGIKNGTDVVPTIVNNDKISFDNPVNLNYGTSNSTSPIYMFFDNGGNIISVDTAFTYKDNHLYIFIGDKFFKFSKIPKGKTLKIMDNYPKHIPEKFGRIPDSRHNKDDGLVHAKDCSIYNGSNNKNKCSNTTNCYFDDTNNKCEPRSLYTSAFVDQKGTTYLFKGEQVYKYNSKSKKISNGYPKLISDVFSGVPSNIDAVFVWGKDLKTYFFKGNFYYRYDDRKKKVERGYPKKSGMRWPGMPSMINAIFTLPYFIDNGKGGVNLGGKNHTYVISGSELYYINPSTDNVSPIGTLSNTLIGMDEMLQIPEDIS